MIWQTLGASLPRRDNPIARFAGRLALRGMGWRIEGAFPDRPKMVVALVPHSSNMDFILTVAVLWGLGLRASFLMKHSLFWFPLGGLLRHLGGIPVDRGRAGGMVGQMIQEFAQRKQLVLGITPEGTRSSVKDFKAGFARIAAAARVPVLPAVLNYKTRTVRFAQLVENVIDVNTIMEQVLREAATGHARAA